MVGLWGVTCRALTAFWNITFFTAGDWLDFLVIFVLKVGDKDLPVPLILAEANTWKFVRFEFLVLRRVGIIKRPLLKWYVFADKVNQPAILLIKVLNKLK